MKNLIALSEHTNSMIEAIEQISDIKERKRFRREISSVVIDIYWKLMMPIVEQHPEFDHLAHPWRNQPE